MAAKLKYTLLPLLSLFVIGSQYCYTGNAFRWGILTTQTTITQTTTTVYTTTSSTSSVTSSTTSITTRTSTSTSTMSSTTTSTVSSTTTSTNTNTTTSSSTSITSSTSSTSSTSTSSTSTTSSSTTSSTSSTSTTVPPTSTTTTVSCNINSYDFESGIQGWYIPAGTDALASTGAPNTATTPPAPSYGNFGTSVLQLVPNPGFQGSGKKAFIEVVPAIANFNSPSAFSGISADFYANYPFEAHIEIALRTSTNKYIDKTVILPSNTTTWQKIYFDRNEWLNTYNCTLGCPPVVALADLDNITHIIFQIFQNGGGSSTSNFYVNNVRTYCPGEMRTMYIGGGTGATAFNSATALTGGGGHQMVQQGEFASRLYNPTSGNQHLKWELNDAFAGEYAMRYNFPVTMDLSDCKSVSFYMRSANDPTPSNIKIALYDGSAYTGQQFISAPLPTAYRTLYEFNACSFGGGANLSTIQGMVFYKDHGPYNYTKYFIDDIVVHK